jgi:hypothetical protein
MDGGCVRGPRFGLRLQRLSVEETEIRDDVEHVPAPVGALAMIHERFHLRSIFGYRPGAGRG